MSERVFTNYLAAGPALRSWFVFVLPADLSGGVTAFATAGGFAAGLTAGAAFVSGELTALAGGGFFWKLSTRVRLPMSFMREGSSGLSVMLRTRISELRAPPRL